MGLTLPTPGLVRFLVKQTSIGPKYQEDLESGEEFSFVLDRQTDRPTSAGVDLELSQQKSNFGILIIH